MGRYTLYNKYISRLVAVLLVLTLLLGAFPAALADGESGSCGSSLSWSLSAGTLTISGSGAMEDFPESTMAPWYHLREEILRLELPEGLTSIGSLAFYGCENLTAVTIPASVTAIGSYAFAQCTGMGMLNMGSGVTSIGESAFSDCYALASLRLPDGLRSLGMKAFYRCESIPTVTVPQSVTSMGMSVFGYCKKLVSADIQANITTVPEYLFYGCENLTNVTLPDSASGISEFAFRGCDQLNTVYYDGSSRTAGEIQQIIGADVPGFGGTGFVTSGQPDNDAAASGKVTENADGTITQENTTVTGSDGATVTVTVENTHPESEQGGRFNAQVTITVDTESGWDDAREALKNGLEDYNNAVSVNGGQNEKVEITIYNHTQTVDPEFLSQIAGKDVTLTVITDNGSSWVINGADLAVAGSGEYDLTYQLTAGSPELCQQLGVATCYVLEFLAPAEVNAKVQIRLGAALALRTATLMQDDQEIRQIQSAVVDQQGCAEFYLASVTDETKYYIAMDLPSPEQEPIVPESLQSSFGATEKYRTIEYEITGRTSSWGMDIGQVTWILVAVMLGSVVIVGVVIFAMNKRKLKRGYVPNLDGEE